MRERAVLRGDQDHRGSRPHLGHVVGQRFASSVGVSDGSAGLIDLNGRLGAKGSLHKWARANP